MSDNNTSPNKFESLIKSPFWNSIYPMLIALAAFMWAAPTDEALEKALKPMLKTGDNLAKLGWTRVGTLQRWFRNFVYRIMAFSLVWAALSLWITYMGVAYANAFVVAVGGGLWTAYAVALWVFALKAVDPVTELAGKGTNLVGTIVGGVFGKLGLATHQGEGDARKLVAHPEALGNAVHKAFALVVVSTLTTTALVLVTKFSQEAPWWSCSLLVVCGMLASAMVSIGYYAGIKITTGWQKLYTWCYRLLIAFGVTALLSAPFPSLRTRIMGIRNAIEFWLANPHFEPGAAMIMLLTVLVAVGLVIAGVYYGTDEKKRKNFFLAAKLMIVPIIAVPIVLISLGSIHATDVGTVSARIQASAKAVVKPSSALQPTSGTVASKTTTSSDGMEDIAEPGTPSTPQKRAIVATESAPESQLDFKGKSTRQILNEFEE